MIIQDSKLKEMSNLIAEAKILIGVNEKLHRCLHVETDRRKALHNKLEDLKGALYISISRKGNINMQSLHSLNEQKPHLSIVPIIVINFIERSYSGVCKDSSIE